MQTWWATNEAIFWFSIAHKTWMVLQASLFPPSPLFSFVYWALDLFYPKVFPSNAYVWLGKTRPHSRVVSASDYCSIDQGFELRPVPPTRLSKRIFCKTEGISRRTGCWWWRPMATQRSGGTWAKKNVEKVHPKIKDRAVWSPLSNGN